MKPYNNRVVKKPQPMGKFQLGAHPSHPKPLTYVRLPLSVVNAILEKKPVSGTINFSKQKISVDDSAWAFIARSNHNKPRTVFQVPPKGSNAPAEVVGDFLNSIRIDFKSREKSEVAIQREREESALKFHEQLLQEAGQTEAPQPSRVYKPPRQSALKAKKHDPASAEKYLETHPSKLSSRISIRAKLVHLLARHDFMLDPICQILDETPDSILSVLSQVAKESNGVYRLKENNYIEVNPSKWPGYTHEDRIQVVKDCHTVFNLLRVPGNAPQRRHLDPYAEEACIIVDPTFALSEEEIKALNSGSKSNDPKESKELNDFKESKELKEPTEPKEPELNSNRVPSNSRSKIPDPIPSRPPVSDSTDFPDPPKERPSSNIRKLDRRDYDPPSRGSSRGTLPPKSGPTNSNSNANPIPLIKVSTRPESNSVKRSHPPGIKDRAPPRVPPPSQPIPKFEADPYSSSIEDADEMLLNSRESIPSRPPNRSVSSRLDPSSHYDQRNSSTAHRPGSGSDASRLSTKMSHRDSAASKESSGSSRALPPNRVPASRRPPSRPVPPSHLHVRADDYPRDLTVKSKRYDPTASSRSYPDTGPLEDDLVYPPPPKRPHVNRSRDRSTFEAHPSTLTKNSAQYKGLLAQFNAKLAQFNKTRAQFLKIQTQAQAIHAEVMAASGRPALEAGHHKATQFTRSRGALYYLEQREEFKTLRDEVLTLKARLLKFV